MATITAGTAATTTLTALIFQRAGLAAADIASISQAILNEVGTGQSGEYNAGGRVGGVQGPFGAFTRHGQLVVPNRGVLQMMPGDLVAVDPVTGWPILLSAAAAAGASFVHS
jgi:hypothetical protein